jgi:hypothetical protein
MVMMDRAATKVIVGGATTRGEMTGGAMVVSYLEIDFSVLTVFFSKFTH